MNRLTDKDLKSLGIYIHIPFCKSKCGYCSFVSGKHPQNIIDRYLLAIKSEINDFLISLPFKPDIKTVYIGGGTPSSVKPDSLRNFVNSVMLFLPDPPLEFTIEANPQDINDAFIEMVKISGINRISIGIQSFNDNVLKMLGRRHDSKTAVFAFNELRNAGFSNLSIDLMHGIPGFNTDRWSDDLKQAIELAPDHISLYALSIEKGTPFYESGISSHLDDDQTAEEYSLAVSTLKKAGYLRYEISNFAIPGKECRHNLNYWRLGDYIGFGPSAGSYLDGEYFERIHDIEEYIARCESGIKTVGTSEKFDKNNQYVNAVIMGMRLEEGINLSELENRFGISRADQIKSLWRDYIDGCYIIQDDDNLKFGENGFYVSNSFLSMLV
jgi:oxygen-independent coproporphyrinogen-3 oxidase